MQQNTPELWDGVWKEVPSSDAALGIRREAGSVRWRRVERAVRDAFGSFGGLRVVEIGAGVGTYSALMARLGAKVALLDYSAEALWKARVLFGANSLSAEFIDCDALAIPFDVRGQFDVSMSFGLAEHFSGADRVAVLRSHFDLLKPGGLALVSVPNKYNPPYRIYKFIAERLGKWAYGEEHPFSRTELRRTCRARHCAVSLLWRLFSGVVQVPPAIPGKGGTGQSPRAEPLAPCEKREGNFPGPIP